MLKMWIWTQVQLYVPTEWLGLTQKAPLSKPTPNPTKSWMVAFPANLANYTTLYIVISPQFQPPYMQRHESSATLQCNIFKITLLSHQTNMWLNIHICGSCWISFRKSCAFTASLLFFFLNHSKSHTPQNVKRNKNKLTTKYPALFFS